MDVSKKKIISLELNEINFEFIKSYARKGHLPNFALLLEKYQLFETQSEKHYPYLEPWIQWPTVYSGKNFDEHKIFRLGDVINVDLPQVWDELEKRSLTVAAISPMNAANRCKKPLFFVPDPWTETNFAGPKNLRSLYELVRFIVNRNSAGNISKVKIAEFGLQFLRHISLSSLYQYVIYANLSRRFKWAKAIILDRLLADIFVRSWKKFQPDYSSIFLNSGAHIQHHHMYESAAYEGHLENPEWYSKNKSKLDPLLVVYKAYDKILADIIALDNVRIFVTTGLSQTPNPKKVFQYRFVDHGAFLEKLGISGGRIVPRMSRDFLVEFVNPTSAGHAQEILATVLCAGEQMIEIENRGDTLFCKICYFGPPEGFSLVTCGVHSFDISKEVVLVSIENGIHQAVGFHIDTGELRNTSLGLDKLPQIPLKSIHEKTLQAFA